MTTVLAARADILVTLVTPFGAPFDTAVIAGALLTATAVLLAGRTERSSRSAADQPGGEPARRTGSAPVDRGEEDPS